MTMAEVSAGIHKCVFCSQPFSSKTELQTHFRLHANGEIDIKGRPKVRHKSNEEKSDAKCSSGEAVEGESASGDAKSSATGLSKSNAVCDVCGEVFRTVSLAISHKFRKHPDSLLKHYCPHCGMMFPIKANCDKHLLTHGGSVPKQVFPCRPCGVTFYNQRAKKFHMDSAHKGAIRLVNPIKTPAPSMKIVLNNAGEAHSVYYCHLCGCEYQVKYNLQKHLATKHSDGERETLPQEFLKCNLCSAVFYTKRAYEVHSHHHRDGDLFARNEQMRQQVVQRIDQDFDQRRVPTAVERYLSASAVSLNRSATWRRIQAARRAHDSTPSNEAEDEGSRIMQDSFAEEDEGREREYLGWEMDDTPKKRRMMDESEEDDGDMRSLGTVNPDCVLSTQVSEVKEDGCTENECREEDDKETNSKQRRRKTEDRKEDRTKRSREESEEKA